MERLDVTTFSSVKVSTFTTFQFVGSERGPMSHVDFKGSSCPCHYAKTHVDSVPKDFITFVYYILSNALNLL